MDGNNAADGLTANDESNMENRIKSNTENDKSTCNDRNEQSDNQGNSIGMVSDQNKEESSRGQASSATNGANSKRNNIKGIKKCIEGIKIKFIDKAKKCIEEIKINLVDKTKKCIKVIKKSIERIKKFIERINKSIKETLKRIIDNIKFWFQAFRKGLKELNAFIHPSTEQLHESTFITLFCNMIIELVLFILQLFILVVSIVPFILLLIEVIICCSKGIPSPISDVFAGLCFTALFAGVFISCYYIIRALGIFKREILYIKNVSDSISLAVIFWSIKDVVWPILCKAVAFYFCLLNALGINHPFLDFIRQHL